MTTEAGHAQPVAKRDADDDLGIGEALRQAARGRGQIILRELDTSDTSAGRPQVGWNRAARSEVRLLSATGRALEVAYPFGVAMQLFDGLRLEDPEASHFSGAGRLAAQLLSGEAALDRCAQPAEVFPMVRSLMAVIQNMARTGDGVDTPIVVRVDGLQHADAPSLRFLAYLAARVDQLPVVLVLVGQQGSSYLDPDAIDAVRAQTGHPAPSTALPAGRTSDPAPAGPSDAGRSRPTERVVGNAATAVGPVREDLTLLAARAAFGGEIRSRVGELAQRAWGDPGVHERLLTHPWLTAHMLRALLAVDELELAAEILGHERHLEAERSSAAAGGAACELRAWTLFHQGRVRAADNEAHRGLAEAVSDDVRQSLRAVIAACHVHSGELTQAETLLSSLDGAARHDVRVLPILLETRAQLRLAQRRPADALRDTMEARRRSSVSDPQSFGPASWRSIAARAHIALGRPGEGRELAARELELASARDVTRRSIGALRALTASAPAAQQIALLERAVAMGDAVHYRLEHLYAVVDLGSVLRRANHRRAARIVLGRAFALADELGAEGAAVRAREELAAAGGRRPQAATTGAEALTPSERRVANLAAGGHSTRQIADELFVTTKTVEFHLRHIYRKLEIPSSRSELARALPCMSDKAQPERRAARRPDPEL